jgi:hypothetical protein
VVNREEGFVLSHDPFAIDMGQFEREVREVGPVLVTATVHAAWFRKRRGVLQACAGTLHGWFGRDHSGEVPQNAEDFARIADRRTTWTSATCMARWDGRTFWAAPPMHPAAQRGYLEMLEPMLAAFPAVPGEYDGWWRFTDVL